MAVEGNEHREATFAGNHIRAAQHRNEEEDHGLQLRLKEDTGDARVSPEVPLFHMPPQDRAARCLETVPPRTALPLLA